MQTPNDEKFIANEDKITGLQLEWPLSPLKETAERAQEPRTTPHKTYTFKTKRKKVRRSHLKSAETKNNSRRKVKSPIWKNIRKKAFTKNVSHRFLYMSIATGIILLLCVLCFIFLLRVRSVTIENLSYYDPAEVIAASGLKKNDHMFFIDKETLSKNICERFPYIRAVQVSRDFPNRIKLTVVQDTPAYYAKIGPEYFVLSSTLRVLERHKDTVNIDPTLKELIAGKISYAVVGQTIKFADASYSDYLLSALQLIESADIFPQIERVDISDRFNIVLNYDHRFQIKVGSYTDLNTKLLFVKGILAQFTENDRGTISVDSISMASVVLENSSS